MRAGGSQPVTAKHSCAQRRWSALDSETAWCSCLQRREQLDKRAGTPWRCAFIHSSLGRSRKVSSGSIVQARTSVHTTCGDEVRLDIRACRKVLSTKLAHAYRRSAFVHKRALHDLPVLVRPVAGLGSETVSEESVRCTVSAPFGVREFVCA